MKSSRVLIRAQCSLLVLLIGIGGAILGEPGLQVENLSFSSTADGLTVYIKTSSPVSSYRCDLASTAEAAGGRSIVLDLPGAELDLASVVRTEDDLLSSVDLESPLEDGPGVRIRFRLDEGALSRLEAVSHGLLLYFQRRSLLDGNWGGASGDTYRIGVGDQIEISVFGHDDLQRLAEVHTDGTINFPLLGDIEVAGESVAKIREDIRSRLAHDYLVDPQVNVEVREYRSRWVTIIGAVRSPSRYVLVRNMQLIDLLAAAGGLSAEAGSEILITRRDRDSTGRRQVAVMREDLFSRDNSSANVLLQAGDIVTVGEREFFYIRGEVNRPDAYIYKNGMTVLKAISVAGGFSQFANRKEVELLRMSDGVVHEKTIINIKAIEDGKSEDVTLRPEDILIIPRRIF